MSQLLLLGNPRRKSRKASAKRRKPRTAAQKAATRRMLAARFGHNPKPAAPARRRSRRKASPAVSRRRSRRSSAMGRVRSFGTGMMPMLKAGVIGGAGGVANDVLFGFASRVLPASMTTPIAADGGTNFTYFAAKAATAVALGTLGRRLPVVGPYASRMGEGALAILAYQLIRPMVPAAVPLGSYNPAPLMAPRRMGAYVSRPQLNGMGAYVPSNVMRMPAKRPA